MFDKAMKRPQLVFLVLPVCLGILWGCSSAANRARFQEVPPYMLGQTNPPPPQTNVVAPPKPQVANPVPQPPPPEKTVALKPTPPSETVELQIVGARPGVPRAALVKGIKNALGPPSPAYSERDQMSDALKLVDRVLAGEKVTLSLPPDMAKSMARSLEQAGLIVHLPE